MKRNYFRSVKVSLFIFIIISIMGVECERQNDDILQMEIGPDTKDQIIQNTIDGIGFKFCLLNEQGEASTVFNEGENFSFHFSVTNYRTEDFYFDPEYAKENENGFCKIYTSENTDLGKPFEFLYALLVGAPAYPFNPGNSCVFEVPWSDDRETEWFWKLGTFESTHKNLLEKGSYYSEFKYGFLFEGVRGNSDLRIDTLSFRINFEIR